MRNALRAFALLCGLILSASHVLATALIEVASRQKCSPSSTQGNCVRQSKVTKVTRGKSATQGRQSAVTEMTEPELPIQTRPTLTQKQLEMHDAYTVCLRNSTLENPVNAVLEYVFQKQAELEDGSVASYVRAFRGSTTHHGHEVCLVRAFGLRGFRSVEEVRQATGEKLFQISSPYVDVVESEVPPDRRVGRPWLRDYVHTLGEEMYRYYEGRPHSEPFAPLRVTSIIRSYEEQAVTVRRGLSPADCRYEYLCSSHTSGSAIDFGFRNVSRTQQRWLEERLKEDQRARKIYFIREGSHFHVFVIPPYWIGEE